MYDAAAKTLRAVYPRISIGGPSTDRASEEWIVALLTGHDVQFITWHRYGAPNSGLHKPDAECLAETINYGTDAARVEAWINTHRPGEGILNVCGELNLSAFCCPTDRRIRESLLIPWYASAMRHLLLNGCDVEQVFVGTDKGWAGFGLFLGTGKQAGLRTPGFLAKALFTAAAPHGSQLVRTTVSGPPTLEALAARVVERRNVVILINKTTASTPVELSISGATVAGGTWYTVDQAACDAGGIRVELAPPGRPLAITLDGYAVSVFEACLGDAACDEDRDGDGLLNLFDDRPDEPAGDWGRTSVGARRTYLQRLKRRKTHPGQPPIVRRTASPASRRF